MMKICGDCRVSKNFDEFSKHSAKADGLQKTCRDCQRLRKRHYYDTHPEYRVEQGRRLKQWMRDNREYAQLLHKIGSHGLTLDQYYALEDSQDFSCAICRVETGEFHIDHDHETGKIRGLLCLGCNVGLGMFKDNSENLQNARNYLTRRRNCANV